MNTAKNHAGEPHNEIEALLPLEIPATRVR